MDSLGAISVVVEEQHEKLRRHVDEWEQRSARVVQECGSTFEGLTATSPGDMWRDPIGACYEAEEFRSVSDLLVPGNTPFNKLVTVFGYLGCEITYTCDRVASRFFPHLLVFGLKISPETAVSEGEVQLAFSRFLPELQALVGQVARLRALLANLVRQLAAVYSPSQRGLYASFRNHVHLQSAVGWLAEGLGMLTGLDAIIAHNRELPHALSSFKRMAEGVRTSADSFGLSAESAAQLHAAISSLEEAVGGGGFFKKYLEEDVAGAFAAELAEGPPGGKQRLVDEIGFCCKEAFTTILWRLDGPAERACDRRLLRCHLALFVWLAWVAPSGVDKRLATSAWGLHIRAPFLPVFACVGQRPIHFLAARLPPGTLVPPLPAPAPQGLRVRHREGVPCKAGRQTA